MLMNDLKKLIDALYNGQKLTESEFRSLIDNTDFAPYAAEKAVEIRQRYYGNSVYIRGLIEISNFCKNDCLYCGIRKSNRTCERYRLSKEEILSCCDEGYPLGFRTFVMQGGEDMYYTDDMLCDIIRSIKEKYPDCAVTLSLGERSHESYKRLKDAGADRYLLRHETADKGHYEKLHPKNLSFENRMECLKTLRNLGFQVGCGFMVGSPYQTSAEIAKDLVFLQEFHPEMCGIGPFIPHSATPFKDYAAGSLDLTCYLLSLVRLILPTVLLPSTTALGSIHPKGREMGILSGANVVMPNLSPFDNREKYMLYNNKLSSGSESAGNLIELKEKMNSIGYEIVISRGDWDTTRFKTINFA
ncbi:MAG: [Clostridia bacterium]|nr:[FeFe] hydrogenase H-cluster radical SAM maturase HydE [Clostridia bacterium]